MYGMQPVIMSDRPYEGVVISERPPSDVFVPDSGYAPHRPPSPGFGRRYGGGPTSSTSSVSGPVIHREIDL